MTAYQQAVLPSEPKPRKKARDRIRGIFEQGQEIGFHKAPAKRGRPAYLEGGRPSTTKLMGLLLDSGEDEELGKLSYSYFSAVTHGTAFGLTQSVDKDTATAPAGLGIKQAAVFTSSEAVCTVLAGLILGSGKALRARNELFLWDSPEWRAATLAAYRSARESLGFTA